MNEDLINEGMNIETFMWLSIKVCFRELFC